MLKPTPDEIVRMERCHVKAWPASETREIDGWLWRSSGGGSQRANSVSTVDFTGKDPSAALEDAEARYRAKGTPSRIQVFDFSAPPELEALLRSRGYQETESTLTMFKRIGGATPAGDAERYDHATAEWLEVYLEVITENRRAVNRLILTRIPEPCAFFACRRQGRVEATALAVAGYGCVVIECVATRGAARRQGAATATLGALEGWAVAQGTDLLGLQVTATNAPAIALYARLGFAAGARNRFWVRDT